MTTTDGVNQPNWIVQVIREVVTVCQGIYNGFILNAILFPILRLLKSLAELGIYFLNYVMMVLIMSLVVFSLGEIDKWTLRQSFMVDIRSAISSEIGSLILFVLLIVGALTLLGGLHKFVTTRNATMVLETSAVCSALWIVSERFNAGVLSLIVNDSARYDVVVIAFTLGIILFAVSYWYKRGGA